jgi:hypothetical protein
VNINWFRAGSRKPVNAGWLGAEPVGIGLGEVGWLGAGILATIGVELVVFCRFAFPVFSPVLFGLNFHLGYFTLCSAFFFI